MIFMNQYYQEKDGSHGSNILEPVWTATEKAQAILNAILNRTGSQCNSYNTGCMRSHLHAPVEDELPLFELIAISTVEQ
jgi:hypothetical protein